MIHFVIMLTRVPLQDCGPVGAVSTLVDRKCGRRGKPQKEQATQGQYKGHEHISSSGATTKYLNIRYYCIEGNTLTEAGIQLKGVPEGVARSLEEVGWLKGPGEVHRGQ